MTKVFKQMIYKVVYGFGFGLGMGSGFTLLDRSKRPRFIKKTDSKKIKDNMRTFVFTIQVYEQINKIIHFL